MQVSLRGKQVLSAMTGAIVITFLLIKLMLWWFRI